MHVCFWVATSRDGELMAEDRVLDVRDFNEPAALLQSLQHLASRAPRPGAKRFIYRGHADAEWALRPVAFRPGTRFLTDYGWLTVEDFEHLNQGRLGRIPSDGELRKINRDFHQKRCEISTLMAFFSAADEAGLPLPEDSQMIRDILQKIEISPTGAGSGGWPPREIRSILALAQHHRLPTRLLDWTWDWRAATFFAARGSISAKASTFAVWALDAAKLNLTSLVRDVTDPAAVSYTRQRLKIVTAPGAANPNLRAQKGLFTLLEEGRGLDPIPPETPLDELDQVGEVQLVKHVLPSRFAGEVLSLLARDGVTAAALYPGYDGVVASLRDQEFWGSSG